MTQSIRKLIARETIGDPKQEKSHQMNIMNRNTLFLSYRHFDVEIRNCIWCWNSKLYFEFFVKIKRRDG